MNDQKEAAVQQSGIQKPADVITLPEAADVSNQRAKDIIKIFLCHKVDAENTLEAIKRSLAEMENKNEAFLLGAVVHRELIQ